MMFRSDINKYRNKKKKKVVVQANISMDSPVKVRPTSQSEVSMSEESDDISKNIGSYYDSDNKSSSEYQGNKGHKYEFL